MENFEKNEQSQVNERLCLVIFYLRIITFGIFLIAYVFKFYCTFPYNGLAMTISMMLFLILINLNTVCFSSRKENITSITMILLISSILFFMFPDHKHNIYDKIILVFLYSTVITRGFLWLFSKLQIITGKVRNIPE
jgi:hypothetical protein